MTLIEMMVVVGTLIVLTALTLPLVRTLCAGSSQKAAINLLTSLLANARALALSTHRPTGLVIYEYPASNLTDATSYVELITQSSAVGRFRIFRPVAGATPQLLPSGIQVATLDGTGNFKKSTDQRDSKSRVILFDSSGQMVLWNGLAADSNFDTFRLGAWNLAADPTDPTTLSAGVSCPGFVVYNAHEYLASQTQAHPVDAATWLRQEADVIVVNPYTGNVIR